jgi:vaccinia related kinase
MEKQYKVKFLGMSWLMVSGPHEYKGEKNRFMVMHQFGTDVQKQFEANKKQFQVNTVLNSAFKIIDVLEDIHDKQYIHADIKVSR